MKSLYKQFLKKKEISKSWPCALMVPMKFGIGRRPIIINELRI